MTDYPGNLIADNMHNQKHLFDLITRFPIYKLASPEALANVKHIINQYRNDDRYMWPTLYYPAGGYYGPYASISSAREASSQPNGYAKSSVVRRHLEQISSLQSLLVERALSPSSADSISPREVLFTSKVQWIFDNLDLGSLVTVQDFGGGFSSYPFVIASLFPRTTFFWDVVDQSFVCQIWNNSVLSENVAQRNFPPNLRIRYIPNLDNRSRYDIFYASCSIHYLNDWASLLSSVTSRSRATIIDRLPLSSKTPYAYNQVVPKASYNTTYAATTIPLEAMARAASRAGICIDWANPLDSVIIQNVDDPSVLYDSFVLHGFAIINNGNPIRFSAIG